MSERRPQIVLARHGETEWSDAKRHTGWTDIPLIGRGREQAATLPRRLREWNFGLVLCSPLQRAQQTFAIAGDGQRAQLRDDLREWNYGQLEGHTIDEWRQTHPGWDIWDDGCPGGETAEEVGRRADRVIAEVVQADRDTVLFAHGHLLRILTVRWMGLAAGVARHLMMSTAAISVLGYEREERVMERWNQAPTAVAPQRRDEPE